MFPGRSIQVYQDAAGVARVRVDAPGERAVSAEIVDPLDLIRDIAFQCGLEVDDSSLPDLIVISMPAGS